MPRFEYELFADYFQFYLQDASMGGDLSESWTEEALARLLAVARGAVGIGTVRNVDVPVVVEVLDAAPELTLEVWDHVVECSLDVPSGLIVVAGCTDFFPDAVRIQVTPGAYRVRVCYEGLDSLSEDGLDGDDRYHVQLWAAPAASVRVIKQHIT